MHPYPNVGLGTRKGDADEKRGRIIAEPEQTTHTSVYDRFQGERGGQIESAAFDLVPVSTEAAGKELRETPVQTLKQRRRSKKRNPTGRRIPRDGWLAPLKLDQQIQSLQPQVHTAGVRASDEGFLQLNWKDYLGLLRWTAKQAVDGVVAKVPPKLASVLASLGIDASMWRDLVWNFKKYFGRGSCAGSPEAMAADAQRHGRSWHRGQKTARAFFAAT